MPGRPAPHLPLAPVPGALRRADRGHGRVRDGPRAQLHPPAGPDDGRPGRPGRAAVDRPLRGRPGRLGPRQGRGRPGDAGPSGCASSWPCGPRARRPSTPPKRSRPGSGRPCRPGPRWTGNPDREDVVGSILAHESPGLDIVFECCGEQSALDQAVALLKPGGTLVVVGIPVAAARLVRQLQDAAQGDPRSEASGARTGAWRRPWP
ncbi:MAG: zinc-binding dehydrogenase [Candidatus Moduliflexus flocculans]|nr:zinc-binding dehydrogenase [Candidatus Moduliflexus flocculans]